MDIPFPPPILLLPQADIPLPGVKAYLSQGDNHQILFMSFSQDVELPEHAHAAQWGIVLEGRIDLTVGDQTYTYISGERYFIPAETPHSSRIYAGYADMTYFDQADRYSVIETSHRGKA